MDEHTLVSTKPRRSRRKIVNSIISHSVVIVGGLIVMVPFLWMLSTSLKEESEAFQLPPQWIPSVFMWSNYHEAVFDYFNFPRYGLNTMIITVGVTIGRLISASLAAYAFARIRFFGRNVLFILVISTLMVPHQVTIIPLFLIYRDLDWLNTYLPLIIPGWLGGGAFFIFLLRQFIMTINQELDDAARIDGCGWFGLYFRIMLPLIKPALATVAIFSFLASWNDFFNPIIFLRSNELFTLPIGLYFYTNAATSQFRPETTIIMAGSTLILIPPVLLFFFAQRYFIQGVVFSGIKG